MGERIRKQRFIKNLTAEELGEKCSCSMNTIYAYESNNAIPHHTIMKKIVEVLDVSVEYFKDDYYTFIFSKDYTSYLKEWRVKNTKDPAGIKKILGVSYGIYLKWEKGTAMSRDSFIKIQANLTDI